MRYPILVARYPVLVIAMLLGVTGCTEPTIIAGNYLTYDHAFTNAAAEKVRQSAEGICKQRNQAAVKTRSVCTLTRCTTDFQCVNPKDPLEYQPAGIGGEQ
jgi:hypothetical protein